jgi:secreted Zn-dependent insulinase-like peptidase
MSVTTSADLGTVAIGPKQYVRSKADLSDFEACTIYDQPDWSVTDPSSLAYIKNKPTIPTGTTTRTFNNPSRSLNTAFQISTTQDALVSYAVDISASLSLSGGQTGTVNLQYADDSGFTTNVKTVQSAANGNTGTLTVGLNLTQLGTATVSGMVPAGKYVRVAAVNTAGTPTFTFKTSQEVLF